MNEAMLWCAWFTIIGFFQLFTQLCSDRFQYVSILSHNSKHAVTTVDSFLFIDELFVWKAFDEYYL